MLPFFYAIRNLGRSPVRLALSLSGSALVVLLVLTAAGFVRGMQQALVLPEPIRVNAMVIGAGSEESVERSEIALTVPGVIAASLRGMHEEGGVSFISPEIHTGLPVRLDETDRVARTAIIRGVQPVALLVHGGVQLTEGRFPRPGSNEVLAGAMTAVQIGAPDAALSVGRTIVIDGRQWTITGRFTAAGTAADTELWMPLHDLRVLTRRETVSCVIVTPRDRSGFAELELFAATRPDLELSVMRESAYYRSIMEFLRPVRLLVWMTALLVSVGGLLGGMNATYAAFAGRVREIGMMQVIGYSRPAIIGSLTQESVLTAACGALIACGMALLFLDGIAVRFTMGSFPIRIDAAALAMGLAAGLVTGLVGAIPPAVRCLRLPVPEALKAH